MKHIKPSLFKMLGLLGAAALLSINSAWAQVDTLASIKQKGKIVVGVKADYKPFGYLDPSGKIVGFEIDMANEIAKNLGVEIELVPVLGANRMEFVSRGRIDLMVATMAYKPERATVVGIPEPFYYASAVALWGKKDSGLKNWPDLKGKTICGVQGAYYNRRAGDEFGAKLLTFKAAPEALAALEAGNCMGFVFDSTFFAGLAGEPKWEAFAITLPLIDPEPWGMGVRKEDAKFVDYLSATLKEWHKTGFIIGLEKKWGLPATPYLIEQQTKFK
jgi:polar amino acid transport system substrate-binding protein